MKENGLFRSTHVYHSKRFRTAGSIAEYTDPDIAQDQLPFPYSFVVQQLQLILQRVDDAIGEVEKNKIQKRRDAIVNAERRDATPTLELAVTGEPAVISMASLPVACDLGDALVTAATCTGYVHAITTTGRFCRSPRFEGGISAMCSEVVAGMPVVFVASGCCVFVLSVTADVVTETTDAGDEEAFSSGLRMSLHAKLNLATDVLSLQVSPDAVYLILTRQSSTQDAGEDANPPQPQGGERAEEELVEVYVCPGVERESATVRRRSAVPRPVREPLKHPAIAEETEKLKGTPRKKGGKAMKNVKREATRKQRDYKKDDRSGKSNKHAVASTTADPFGSSQPSAQFTMPVLRWQASRGCSLFPFFATRTKTADVTAAEAARSLHLTQSTAPLATTSRLCKVTKLHTAGILAVEKTGGHEVFALDLAGATECSDEEMSFPANSWIMPYAVTSATISPSTAVLAVGLAGGVVVLFDLSFGKPMMTARLFLQHSSSPCHLSFYKESLLAVLCEDVVDIFDILSKKRMQSIPSSSRIDAIDCLACLDDDAYMLALASSKEACSVWSCSSAVNVCSLLPVDGATLNGQWACGGKYLALGAMLPTPSPPPPVQAEAGAIAEATEDDPKPPSQKSVASIKSMKDKERKSHKDRRTSSPRTLKPSSSRTKLVADPGEEAALPPPGVLGVYCLETVAESWPNVCGAALAQRVNPSEQIVLTARRPEGGYVYTGGRPSTRDASRPGTAYLVGSDLRDPAREDPVDARVRACLSSRGAARAEREGRLQRLTPGSTNPWLFEPAPPGKPNAAVPNIRRSSLVRPSQHTAR